MKNFKRILALALIALMTLSLAACGKTDAEKLIGKWNFDTKSIFTLAGVPEDQTEMVESLGGVSGSMEFTKDGKCIMSLNLMGQPLNEEGTYTVEGNKLTIDTTVHEFKIEKKTLYLTDTDLGATLTLTKAK
ncbi:MAG: hypothetical protein IKJ65_11675 [Clostridia bacterium]|nr:hypothetical protein [Clostridia bacterium]